MPVYANPGLNPYAGAYNLPRPVYGHPGLAQLGQFAPVAVAPQFAMPQASMMGATPAKSDTSPFRIFVADDDVASTAGKIALASTGVQNASYGEAGCDAACEEKSCGCKGECCCPQDRFRFFGGTLYLRARDAEVAYAVESDSNLPLVEPPVQVSPIAMVDQDFSSGYRAGFGVSLDACSEFAVTYTMFDTSSSDQITKAVAINNIVSMVLHPATAAADAGTVSAAGRHDIAFDLVDVDYRRAWREDESGNIGYLLGFRWGQLEQNFNARFTNDLSQPVNTGQVFTDVDFSGVGIRFGLEAERFASRVPLMFYAKGLGSILAGEFDATYLQTGAAGAAVDVNTRWQAGRIVPTFDLELGGGFCSADGRFRATAGYSFGVWTNIVKTNDFINAVQNNDFRDMNDDMTFDGIVTHIEARF